MKKNKLLKRRLSPHQLRVVSFLGWLFLTLICKTMRFQSVGEEELLKSNGAVIMAWHGQQLLGFYYLRKRGYTIITSLSKDGDFASSIMQRFGWKIVRGSSNRGGARGLLELVRQLRNGAVTAITPDGPSGPIHHVEQGTVYMAQKTGVPLIPHGYSLDRYWELKTWDKFIIPKPFSRCLVYFGPGLRVSPELNEDEFEAEKQRIAEALHDANAMGRRELDSWLGRA